MKMFIYQGNDHDCGFAALKMFLAHLAKDKSYLYIPKPAKRENYNLNDLTKIAADYGVPLESYGCNKEYYDDLEVPSLTLIDENHVVMVKKKTKRRITLYDPEKGVIKIRKDEFLRRWRCTILVTNEPESVYKISKIRQNILPTKYRLIECGAALFSSIVLIGAFYLLNKTENFVFSLIFLGLFVVSQIIEKFVLYKQVYTFDSNYIPRYFDVTKNCSKQKYKNYVEFKEHYFTSNRGLLSSILTAFVITFLLCFNDFRNVFVLLAMILFKMLELIIFSKKDEKDKNIISDLESKSFDKPHLAKNYALDANLKADSLILYNSIKELFYILLSFTFALVMMFVTNNTGCNFVIFHFAMYLTGFNSYNIIINGLSLRKDNQIKERRFFDSCNL